MSAGPRRGARLAGLAAALGLAGAVGLAGAARAERIRDFDVDLAVEADATLQVRERIVYDFEGAQRHGIQRDIPVRYERRVGSYHIALDVERVTDASGAPRPYRVLRRGSLRRIRVGSADRTVTGVQEYVIEYRVRRAVLFFEGSGEIYWNATGTEWDVPIDRAAVRVRLPPGVGPEDVRLGCFTGPFGSRATECETLREASDVRFVSERPLAAREGLSVVVGLPTGALPEPGWLERVRAAFGPWGGLWALLPLATLAGMGRLWWTVGRDRGARDAIPVRYEPPDGLAPAEVGVVLDERADLADVTATILDLAVRGYLTIEEVESRRFLFLTDRDYVLHRRRPDATGLKPFEARLFQALFRSGDTVKISELRNHFHDRLEAVKKLLYQGLSGRGGCFPASPERVKTLWTLGGVALAGAGFLALGTRLLDGPPAVCVMLAGAVVLAFSRSMPRRTRRGRRAFEEIQGFREFLLRVDADRLERLGTRTTGTFERLLPHAIVLGAADAWAEAFADLYARPPEWYVGPATGTHFQPRHFVSDVGRGLGTIGQSLASRPRGSGSSGFSSGGGFSGGGFGGGGGSSW